MCVGYIAVVKKGQDLTVPGARDDLFEIFSKQRDRLIRKMMTKKHRESEMRTPVEKPGIQNTSTNGDQPACPER